MRRSSLDSAGGAGPGKAIRAQLEAPRPSLVLWRGRLSGHGRRQARVSGGSACPACPEPFRIEAVMRVLACCRVDDRLVRLSYIYADREKRLGASVIIDGREAKRFRDHRRGRLLLESNDQSP